MQWCSGCLSSAASLKPMPWSSLPHKIIASDSKLCVPERKFGFSIVLSGVSPCYCHANLRDRFSYCFWDRDSPQSRIRERREIQLQATTACQTGLATLQELKVKMGTCTDALTRTGICRSDHCPHQPKKKIESGFSLFKFPLFPKLCFKNIHMRY